MRSAAPGSPTDRLLFVTSSLSLAGHAVVLAAMCLVAGWAGELPALKAARLVYEPDAVPARSQRVEELHRIQVRLKQLTVPSSAPALGSTAGMRIPGPVEPTLPGPAAPLGVDQGRGDGAAIMTGPEREAAGAAIDLSNLTAASHGNPVTYSYFRAIREQIQRTANERAWLPGATDTAGLVFISFVLARSGAIQSAGIVPDRSVASDALRGAALRIVKTAGPFLPFPPSFQEPVKALIVPIEFTPEDG